MQKGYIVNENNKKGSRGADVFIIHMVAENMQCSENWNSKYHPIKYLRRLKSIFAHR